MFFYKFHILFIALILVSTSCSRFRAERLGSEESDEKALKITDKWIQKDTEKAISSVISNMKSHNGLRKYLRKRGKAPAIFVGEIKNLTSEPYFPVNDLSDELLNSISQTGDYVLVDDSQREALLNEITYQKDGMVSKKTVKKIGRQTGADLMIFGNVYMKSSARKGKTIKQYSINIRMTDIEKGVEVFRTRFKISKYSKKSFMGW